jgi:arylsulfatase A-like enzyme
MTLIDERIGAILASLGQQGYLDNAVVLFCSDHGDCLGEHGLIQKWAPYDCITRTPLIAWSPQGLRAGAGATVDGLCQLFDVGPTILDLAGCATPKTYEARSLLPAIEGKPWQARDTVYCEQAGDTNLTGCELVTMVRTRNWKLVHYKDKAYGQLFDLAADPAETNNRWADPDCAGMRQQLLDNLREWLIQSNYVTRDYQAQAR